MFGLISHFGLSKGINIYDHYLARLYGSILESELSIWAKQDGCRSVEQAGFWKRFTTLDHILPFEPLSMRVTLRRDYKDILMTTNPRLFRTNKGSSINMDKTKMMVFNTTQAWVTRSKQEFFLGEEKAEYILLHIPRSNIYRA